MSILSSLLEVIFSIWASITVTNIFWKIITGFKAHVWCSFNVNRVNLVEKYGPWAVVTGSSDGIGKEYAKELAKRGLNVVLISRTREKLEKVAAEIREKYNVKTKIIAVDFTQGESVYQQIQKELKDILVGILVNNVGMSVRRPLYFSEMTYQQIWAIINVNVGATLQMTRMVLPLMQIRRKGAIVNVSSGAELISAPLASVYSSSKALIRNFTNALRFECKKYGITVQNISPCLVKTHLTEINEMAQIDSVLTISAQMCARSAVNTLSFADHSAGYWTHGIQYFFLQITPEWLRTLVSGYVAQILRRECMKKNQNENNKETNGEAGIKT